MYVKNPNAVKFEPSAAYLFKYLLLANMIQYMEAGAVPALLLALSHSFSMQPGQQGLLGAVVYLSLSLGGPLAGWLLRKYDHKRVLVCSIGTNLLLTFIWAMTPIGRDFSTAMFIAVRFVMGFTQCIVCVFLPLWTMENAPKTTRTIWMSYLQASVPFGVMCGYIVASVTISTCSPSAVSDALSNHAPETCFGLIYWRWPFLVEILLLLPLFVLLQFVPARHISVHTGQKPKTISSYKINEKRFRDREVSSSQHPSNLLGEGDSSSHGSKDDRPTSSQRREEQVGGFTRYINAANGSNSNVKMLNGQRYTNAAADDDSDDDRKYDDEYIKLKAQLLAEEKRQWLQLQRNSMSASMYDSMASINVAVRGSGDYSFVDTDDFLPNPKRQGASGAYRPNQYGSVGAELVNIQSDGKSNESKADEGLQPPSLDSVADSRLRSAHHSMSNISDSSESSSKATKWIFSFFPLNMNAMWKSSLGFTKFGRHHDSAISSALPSLDRLDVEAPPPINEHLQSKTNYTNEPLSPQLEKASIEQPLSKSQQGASDDPRRPYHRLTADNRSLYSVVPEGVSMDKSPSSRNSLSGRAIKKKAISRKKATYSLQYESLRELPAVPKSIGFGVGIGMRSSNEMFTRQRSSTMPSSTDAGMTDGMSNSYMLDTTFLRSDSRNNIPKKTNGLQILSPLFDWRRSSRFGSANTGSKYDDTSMDDSVPRMNSWRSNNQGFFLSRTRSKSLDPISSSVSIDLDRDPLSTAIMSVKCKPSRERSWKKDFISKDLSVKNANAENFVQSYSVETEKEKLLKHLMMSRSSSDSNLFRHLDTKNRMSDDDFAQPAEGSPLIDDPATKVSAFSRYISTPKRNAVEYFSNSESEEEWLGLDNDASYSTSSPFYGGGRNTSEPSQSGIDHSVIERQSLLPNGMETNSSFPRVFIKQFSSDVSKGCNCLRKSFQTVNSLLAISEYRNLLGAVTALYFTVTGVQYWGTKYLSIALNAPMPLVNSLFIICAATGPTSGVFFGGWLIDLFGGFKGPRQRIVALELCAVLGVLACLFALPITFIGNIFAAVTCLWMVLFFGGSTLPACSGIIVSIVPRRHRPTSSSLSLVVFNLFGYFLSLILSGYLMQLLEQEDEEHGNCSPVCAMTWGFRLVLFWSFFSLYFLLNALRASYVRSRND